jgi:hypothetical protein
MPRFYFDIRESGTFIEDEDGMLLPDLEAAKRVAAESAAEIGRDRLPQGAIQCVSIDVRNENGDNLLSVTVSLTIEQASPSSSRKRRSRSGDTGQGAGPP